MNKLIRRIRSGISVRILNAIDARIDRKICGQSLVPYVPSIYRDNKAGLGGTGSQSTHYVFLKRIFSHVRLKPEDVLLDVGCGKGRVLAFLLRESCPCAIYGIEHNEEVAAIAKAWTGRTGRAEILTGDALALDYDRFTVLTLACSFLPNTFLAFVERVEQTVSHPITLVYWYDQESGYLLFRRPGWKVLFREKVSSIHGLKIAPAPQSYSVWIYDPEHRDAAPKGETHTFEELLARDGRLVYRTRGVSMEPMLRQNRDLVIIEPPSARLRRYDVALYKRGDLYVLHRVIRVGSDHYRIRGDNTYAMETVPDNAVIGVLAAFQRKGKTHQVTERGYRLYVRIWNAIYPVRRAYRYLRAAAGKVLRKLGLR